MKTRDMTQAQFHAACKRAGFVPEGLGYYHLPIPGHDVAVNVLNAGHRLRDRLAYLHAKTERLTKEYANFRAVSVRGDR
jgi:hypothetical protein